MYISCLFLRIHRDYGLAPIVIRTFIILSVEDITGILIISVNGQKIRKDGTWLFIPRLFVQERALHHQLADVSISSFRCIVR